MIIVNTSCRPCYGRPLHLAASREPRSNSGARGEPYSKHTHHFFRIVSVPEMEVAKSGVRLDSCVDRESSAWDMREASMRIAVEGMRVT